MKRRSSARPDLDPSHPTDRSREGGAPIHPAVALAAVFALVVSIAVTFSRSPSNGFVMFDDDLYVTACDRVQAGLDWDNVRWAFTTTEAANWHPLTWLSHMLDVELFGLDPGRHHLASLLLHLVGSVLLLVVLFRLTGAFWRSAFVAALFGLHPLHVESVAWIAERKDVLSTVFWFASLLAWIDWVRSGRRVSWGLALLAFALGLMTKPMLVTLPFTLLLLDFWPLERLSLSRGWPGESISRLLWEKAPFFVFAAASSVVTLAAQKAGGTVQSLAQLPFSERAMNAAEAYVAYLGKTFWPVSLAVFYPHPRTSLSGFRAALSGLALVGLTILVLRLRRKAPYLSFGWFWFLGTLVPVIGLVQVGEQAMADRYTYVPLVGLFIAVAWSLGDLAGENRTLRRSLAAVCLVLLALLGATSHLQTGRWKDSETLFRHALAVTGPNSLARNNFGLVLFEQGRLDEAIVHLQEAIRIDPSYSNAHINLGIVLAKQQKWSEAIEQYETALELEPGAPSALVNLGNALLRRGRPEEAAERFRAALAKKDFSVDAHLGLASAIGRAGRPDEALEHVEIVLRKKPPSAEILTLRGKLFGQMGRFDEAFRDLEEAVRLDPKHAPARQNLGVALDRSGKIPEAIVELEEAVRLDPSAAEAFDNLGLCLARSNRIPEAVGRLEEAVRLAPGSASFRSHLALALARTNRFDEAERQLREVLRLRPDDADARATLEKVRRVISVKR